MTDNELNISAFINAVEESPALNGILEGFDTWAGAQEKAAADSEMALSLSAAFAVDLNCRESAGVLVGREEEARRIISSLGHDAPTITRVREEHNSLAEGDKSPDYMTGYSAFSTFAAKALLVTGLEGVSDLGGKTAIDNFTRTQFTTAANSERGKADPKMLFDFASGLFGAFNDYQQIRFSLKGLTKGN